MMKTLKTIGIIINLIIFLSIAHAMEDRIKFEKALDLKAELSGAFIKDSDGFLWIGSVVGLFRYDGYELKCYKAGANSISANWILSITEDKDKVIWIGTNGAGINSYDKKIGIFKHYKHNPNDKNSLSSNAFAYSNQTLFVDKSGILWIGTQGGGLNRFDKKTNTFTHYKNNPNNKNSLSNDKVNNIIEDRDGILWIGTEEGGLNRFDPKNQIWTNYKHDSKYKNTLSNDNVQSIIEDRDGILWIGTEKGGLNKFDKKTKTFVSYINDPNNPNSIGDNKIFSIYEDRLGRLWLCHYYSETVSPGLSLFDKKTETCVRYINDTNISQTISTNIITRVYEDSLTGILWVINYKGQIDKYDKNAKKFRLWQNNPKNPKSLSDSGVQKIYEDRKGILWFGTSSGGLNKFDKKTETFTRYLANEKDPNSFPNQWITGILEDSSGTFWVASKNILTIFDRETGKVIKRYEHNPNNPSSFTRCTTIRSIVDDKNDPNFLWIGTHGGGLAKLDKKLEKFTIYKNNPKNNNSLSHDVMRIIYDDGKGTIWCPTFNGFNRFDKKTQQFKHYFNKPNDPKSIHSDFLVEAFADSSGRLWITGKGGVSRFDEKTETFKTYTKNNGLPDELFIDIREDDQTNLWISSAGAGLIKFNPKTESVKIYTESDGLQGSGFWGDSCLKTKNGEMWFGGPNGVNSFYPKEIRDNPYIPPVMLTSFKQGGVDVNLGMAPEKLKEVKLDWKANFFEFQFAALNYTMPEKNQYAYMIKGIDRDWYYSGTKPFGRYSNIPGGTYILRLKGSNNDGVWNNKEFELKLIVVSPFWKKWWFYTLIGLGIILFSSLLYKQNIKQVKLANEMKLAKKIQTVLLPKKPEIEGFEIAVSMEPADEVGGDYYDVVSVEGYNWILIGDVSGHGITAGLVMMMVQSAIHTMLLKNPSVMPSELLAIVNKTIYDNIEKMQESKHMTIIALAVGKDGLVSFAGLHEDIFIWRKKTKEIEKIKTNGMWIGILPDISEKIATESLNLESGDCMVLYTDGIIESKSKKGEFFGESRLLKIIKKSGFKSASEIHFDIIESLKYYEKSDDITLFVMKRA